MDKYKKLRHKTGMLKSDARFPNLSIVEHPIISHQLGILRDKKSTHIEYKEALRLFCAYMAPFVSGYLTTKEIEIETPLENTKVRQIAETPVIVPILRAGLGLSEPLKDLMPFAKSGHIGVYRDEETKQPVEYLVKLPKIEASTVFLVDPMLATGNSAKYAIDILLREGAVPENIKMMILLAAPEGVENLYKEHPNVHIYTGALDRELNNKAYILPGLGDAGDRLFGTT